jgi:hypothetical protein
MTMLIIQSILMLSVIYAKCHILANYAECQYTDCCYAECHGAASRLNYIRKVFWQNICDSAILQRNFTNIFSTKRDEIFAHVIVDDFNGDRI